MTRCTASKAPPRGVLLCVLLLVSCSTSSPALQEARIHHPLVPPELPPPPVGPTQLPAAPVSPAARPEAPPTQPAPNNTKDDHSPPNKENSQTTNETLTDVETLPPPRSATRDDPLELEEVLSSVEQHFPLLLAAEQEYAVAAGQRLAAEGAFDLYVRARGVTQQGTFPSERFEAFFEQPVSQNGVSFFSGYRFGFGEFPVYYGDRFTADGGEFRAGVHIPLLRDRPIDRRRANLRQAQIGEALANPVVQRARIDYLRAAARAYWNWVAAGEQYRVAEALLRIATDRQAGLEQQFRNGQIAEFVVIDNRRLIVEREGFLIAAERRWQQTSFELSLFLRDQEGNLVVPPASRLPPSFVQYEPRPPATDQLSADVQTAYSLRPELTRFRLLKERLAVELQLAQNQMLPGLNLVVSGAQDVGKGKTASGAFALDRSLAEASLALDVPWQRREARGRAQAAQATMTQILAQEQFARDQIRAEVQDAVSNLDRTYQRLQLARQEQTIAKQVAELERERFHKGASNLLEVNLREVAAAGAQAKVIDALADFLRAEADYRAALGLDARPDRNR